MKPLLLLPLALFAACRSEPAAVDGVSIRGSVYNDRNGNGAQDEGEGGVADIPVFVDLNRDAIADENEPQALTDDEGRYSIPGLEPGSYVVRQELPFGYRNEVDGNSAQSGSASGVQAIIGGADVDAENYPFMVSVGTRIGSDFSQFCGGALIADTWVLTAAHCVEDTEAEDVAVMLGSQLADEGGQLEDIAEIRVHPLWTGTIREGYDMALLRLTRRLKLEELGLNTVDLVRAEDAAITAPGTLATTIGWGTSDNPSEALQEVHLPITSEDVCAEAYPVVRTFETQICAGARSGGIDSCQGDSGGPFLVRDAVNERWMHAGITSWGTGCALPGKPGIYGRTSKMSAWAHEQLLEGSLAYNVELSSKEVIVDFSIAPTTRPMLAPSDDRWSLSNLEIEDVQGDAIEANRRIELRFFLFTDTNTELSSDNFSCTFDRDGDGPEASAEVACAPGINQLSVDGYEDGVYRSTLAVVSPSREGRRSRLLIAGTPEFLDVTGTLSAVDGTDPDFPGDFYIDHFALEDLTPGVVALIEVDATFGVQLALYDGDVRDQTGGGLLDSQNGQSPNSGRASLQLVPQAGRSYIVGVSSLSERRSGDYQLRMVNSGTAVPTNL